MIARGSKHKELLEALPETWRPQGVLRGAGPGPTGPNQPETQQPGKLRRIGWLAWSLWALVLLGCYLVQLLHWVLEAR